MSQTRVLRSNDPVASHESLSLEWVFGLHKDSKSVIYNLSTSPTERVVFYTIGHIGVIYDAVKNTQRHLMGHRHTIIASACSRNRRFIVTADSGGDLSRTTATTSADLDTGTAQADLSDQQTSRPFGDHEMRQAECDSSIMIVWDTHTCIPICTIPTGLYGGVVACAMSLNGMYIATLNRHVPQKIMLWGWTAEKDVNNEEVPIDMCAEDFALLNKSEPEYYCAIPAQDEQTCIRFSEDNPHFLVTNGPRRVFFWSWAEGELKYYSPPILAKNMKLSIGSFTQSILIPGTTMGCSGTVDGDVILWEVQPRDRVTKEQDKTMLKMVRIHSGSLTFLTWSNGYIVTGGVDGHVKFLDTKLRHVAWFEDLNGGSILSIAFDWPPPTVPVNIDEIQREHIQTTEKKVALVGSEAITKFSASDFMVSTANAMIIDVAANSFHLADPQMLRGKLIVQGQEKGVRCIAAHPKFSRIAISGHSGTVHIWDYVFKRVLLFTVFQGIHIHCIAYDPTGVHLAIGCTNGIVKFLDADSLEERKTIKPKRPNCITRMVFAETGNLLATADSAGCVGLYEYSQPYGGNAKKAMEWDLVGRHKAHRGAISGLQFGNDDGVPRLLSVGEDKRLVEYDLTDSEAETGLLVRTAHKITQSTSPTGFFWVKENGILLDTTCRAEIFGRKEKDDIFLLATDGYKLTAFLSDWSRQCIKSVLSPTFGGPITEMFTVPIVPGSDKNCLFYATQEKVIGLMQLPLLGDPVMSTGLVAHPGVITSVTRSLDGVFVFTAGGDDQSVMQWRVNGEKILPSFDDSSMVTATTPLENCSDVPLDHLMAAIEGGKNGRFMREIVDYFYYAQIRLQGEETTAKRELLGTVPFSQVPNLFRALGYYPSELEIGRLTYEVANLYGPVDEPVEECNVETIPLRFSQFMRLYVNYRPIYGITRQDIDAAFLTLGADPLTGHIARDVLFKLLGTHGEVLQPSEIAAMLRSLLGEGVRVEMLEDTITPRAFAENLLGFEDYCTNDTPGKGAEEHNTADGERMTFDT